MSFGRCCTFLFATAAIVGVTPALADGVSDQAAAEQLFREGRHLEDGGRWPEACAAYAESQRRDASAGTLLRLGNCYEKLGKTASAWITFKDAIKASEARNKADWVQLARARATALEPILSKLIVRLEANADIEGLRVERDGSEVGRAELGVSIPVDPGVHVVRASAPGRQPWSTSTTIDATTTGAVVVPVLALTLTAPAAPERDKPPSGTAHRMLAFSLGGAGIVGLTIGTIGGVVAIDKHSSAVAGCTAYPRGCSDAAKSANGDAYTWSTVSTAAVVLGGLALAAGVVLLLTAPSSDRSSSARLWVSPSVGEKSVSLAAGGAW